LLLITEEDVEEDPANKDLKARLASRDMIVLTTQTERAERVSRVNFVSVFKRRGRKKSTAFYLGCITLINTARKKLQSSKRGRVSLFCSSLITSPIKRGARGDFHHNKQRKEREREEERSKNDLLRGRLFSFVSSLP
jgi:hypothetical protein|tara:strand:- start:1245 stop:1655 length:411 start_codon:yes stop_codon:yes gene_type:complete